MSSPEESFTDQGPRRASRLPPFSVQSVAFAYPGNQGTVPLRDAATLSFLGDEPEWTAAGRNASAAFIGGSRPSLRVVFARPPMADAASSDRWRIRAKGHGGPGVAEQEVTLTFDADGQSAAVEFQLDAPLPTGIGKLRPRLTWYASGSGGRRRLGETRHGWLISWRTPIAPAIWASPQEPQNGPVGQPDVPWVYHRVMEWTCSWAVGQNDEKAICDALLSGMPASKLKYGVAAWNVHDMLLAGGGYCGGFFRLLQSMAGSQGVQLTRRQVSVDWRDEPQDEVRWCAIVVENPGLNRRAP